MFFCYFGYMPLKPAVRAVLSLKNGYFFTCFMDKISPRKKISGGILSPKRLKQNVDAHFFFLSDT